MEGGGHSTLFADLTMHCALFYINTALTTVVADCPRIAGYVNVHGLHKLCSCFGANHLIYSLTVRGFTFGFNHGESTVARSTLF